MATFVVSNEQELREALQNASGSNEPNTIILSPGFGTVELSNTPLLYSGTQPLTIVGNGATLTQDDPASDIFVSNGGADLTIQDLNLAGGHRGIGVDVPAGETGTVTVTLTGVSVTGTFYHGVHVDDQTKGSDASVVLNLTDCFIDSNGVVGDNTDSVIVNRVVVDNGLDDTDSPSDSDGVRVDEGGLGNATVNVVSSVVTNNGADGLEIDEKGGGSVFLTVSKSTFDDNGRWDISDFDDGIDVDEADGGNIVASISYTTISNNRDEGLDLDEAGDGSVRLDLSYVEINDNTDEGLKVTEEDAGDIITGLNNLTTSGNGGRGIELEQLDGGTLVVNGRNIIAWNNDGDGIRLLSETSDGQPKGTVNAIFRNLNAQNNEGDSIDVRAGSGSLTLLNPFFRGNDDNNPAIPDGFVLTILGGTID
jgi:hypothetical protein